MHMFCGGTTSLLLHWTDRQWRERERETLGGRRWWWEVTKVPGWFRPAVLWLYIYQTFLMDGSAVLLSCPMLLFTEWFLFYRYSSGLSLVSTKTCSMLSCGVDIDIIINNFNKLRMQPELRCSCEDEMPSSAVICHHLTNQPHGSDILQIFILQTNEIC